MELHQLHYVVAVADTGSFTRAAERLRVSQSGVSTQVQKLERELGVALFDRSSRRISVTSEGERVIPGIRAAVAAIDRVGALADDIRGVVIGSVRLGTVTGLTWSRFFDAVTAIHGAYPGVDLRLIESTSDDLVAQVSAGRLDVAVAAWSPKPPSGLKSVTIFDDALVAVVAKDHPWAARKRVTARELSRTDLITLPAGAGARIALDAMFSRAGIHAQPRWEVASPAYLTTLASRGLGVAVASETTLADADDLVMLAIDDPEARSQLGVVWRADPGPATAAFLAELIPGQRKTAGEAEAPPAD